MGNLWIPDAADWLRAFGLDVIEYPGWLTRSRSSGGFDDIYAIGLHHDASAAGRSGQRSADAHWRDHPARPVGNFSLDRGGTWWVGAAGATNTQGRGGPFRGSRGTIPLDQGNRYTVAVEAGNNGVGELWPVDQLDSYASGIAALIAGLRDEGAYDAAARRYRPIVLDPMIDPIAHFEWTPRKIDPAGPPSPYADVSDRYRRWIMPVFRSSVRDALTITTPPRTVPGGTMLHTLDPHTRIADTRDGTGGVPVGMLRAGGVLRVRIPRIDAAPDPKTAIVNVTTIDPTSAGFVQVTGTQFGGSSTGNLAPGLPPVATPCIAAIVDGEIQIRLGGNPPPGAHVAVDLQGVVD